MGELINLPDVKGERIYFDVNTPEVMTAAYAIDDYLKMLPLSSTQHNKLVELMVAYQTEAKEAAFLSGIEFSLSLGGDHQWGN